PPRGLRDVLGVPSPLARRGRRDPGLPPRARLLSALCGSLRLDGRRPANLGPAGNRMKLPFPPRAAFIGGLALVAALPLAPRLFGATKQGGCTLDGLAVDSRREVRVVLASGSSVRFCGVQCAARWLHRTDSRPQAVFVTDETSGLAVRAEDAWFVMSPVAATRGTGDHVHAFARREDAERHAAAYRGTILEGP